ncbi:unnamed protein product [Caenorhabditis auriculariae]|uniref:Peptidase A1 domain-containing protein n=1 Tax=Caenorhabditis auriculariae TaxID=2777116 RepID=A0A8S1GRL5_9PELO|nr:unnamed protein product [Caenorhabditis auriculariae]
MEIINCTPFLESCAGMLVFAAIFLLSAVGGNAFRLPFKLAAVTNVTEGEETMEQVSVYFYANITVGTPGQLFSVLIDTSSADLLIADSSCNHYVPNSNSSCYGKNQFISSASSTYTIVGKVTTVSTKFGPTKGMTGADVVRLGTVVSETITVPGVTFLQVSDFGTVLQGVKADGVLGLALMGASQTSATPTFVQAVQQGDAKDSIFSIWLEHQNQTNDLGTHGVIHYGGSDTDHCNTTRQSVQLSGATYFQVTVANVNSTSGNYSLNSGKNTQAYIDSTSPYISVPPPILMNIMKVLNLPAQSYPPKVPCNAKITLGFSFAGGAYVEATEKDLILMLSPGVCQLSVNQNDASRIILGIPFFRGQCISFDVVRHAVTFSQALSQN